MKAGDTIEYLSKKGELLTVRPGKKEKRKKMFKHLSVKQITFLLKLLAKLQGLSIDQVSKSDTHVNFAVLPKDAGG